MPKVAPILNNFTSGEISPKAYGRVDTVGYFNGCAKMYNFFTMPFGGFSKMPGTYFIKEVKNSSEQTYIRKFQFNTEQKYKLEFGDEYLRFYKDNGAILETNQTITDATQANPCVITCASHGYSDGDQVYIDSVIGMTELNGKYYTVSNASTNDFELSGIDSTGYTAYVSDGTVARVYEIATTYAIADVPYLQFKQNADSIIITHQSYTPKILSRSDHDSWSLTDFFSTNIMNSTNVISGGTWTLLSSVYDGLISGTAATGQTDAYVGKDFINTVEIRQIRIYGSLSSYNGTFTFQYSDDNSTWNDTNIVAQLVSKATGWNDFDINSYGTHRYWRLLCTVANSQLNELEMYENTANWFMPMLPDNSTKITLDASNTTGSITITASSNYFNADMVGTMFRIKTGYVVITGYTSETEVDAIVRENLPDHVATTDWAEGAFSEHQGFPKSSTFYEQRICFGGTTNKPQSFYLSKNNNYYDFRTGSDATDGKSYTLDSNMVNAIVWLYADKKMIIGTTDGVWVAEDLTADIPIVNKHTFYGCTEIDPINVGSELFYIQEGKKILRQLVYSYENERYNAIEASLTSEHFTNTEIIKIDALKSPYSMLFMLSSDGSLYCITRQYEQNVMSFFQYETNGVIEDFNIDGDEITLIVNRTINSSTKRYIEYLKPFDFGDDIEDAFFVDCGLTYEGTATTSISGLEHLEGETVAIFANGVQLANKTVSSGTITGLESSTTKAHIGLPMTDQFKTLKLEYGSVNGTAQGKLKRINSVMFRVYKSCDFYFGTPDDSNNLVNIGTDLYTGDTELLQMPPNSNTNGQIVIKSNSAYPLTILAIMPILETEDV